MPVRKVGPKKYKWGKSGRTYPTKKQAEKQGKAAYARGYKNGGKRGGTKRRSM